MGYCLTDFKLLERDSNAKFMCNGCSSSDLKLGGVKCHEEFTRGNVEVKDTLEKAK